jgi:hypothetical protein
VVKVLSKAGYTKGKVKQHFHENTKLKVSRLSEMIVNRFYKGIEEGNWPEQLGTSKDTNRYIQMVSCPDDFLIVVSGDPDRDHVLICANKWIHGLSGKQEVELPSNWEELLKAAKRKP